MNTEKIVEKKIKGRKKDWLSKLGLYCTISFDEIILKARLRFGLVKLFVKKKTDS